MAWEGVHGGMPSTSKPPLAKRAKVAVVQAAVSDESGGESDDVDESMEMSDADDEESSQDESEDESEEEN